MSKKLILPLALFLGLLISITFQSWPGNQYLWWLFNLSFIAMLSLGLIGRINNAYLFFSVFLFLGIWCKLIWHFISYNTSPTTAWYSKGVIFPFIEPTGEFNGTIGSWENVMLVSAISACAVAVPRLLQLILISKEHSSEPTLKTPPNFYLKWRILFWAIATSSLLILNIYNQYGSFYQVGVNPSINLPLHLNVVISWMLTWGFAFSFAVLAFWELQTKNNNRLLLLLVLLVEASITSISTISRSTYLVQGFAFCQAWLSQNLNRKNLAIVTSLFLLGLLSSLIAVQLLRVEKYVAPMAKSHAELPAKPKLLVSNHINLSMGNSSFIFCSANATPLPAKKTIFNTTDKEDSDLIAKKEITNSDTAVNDESLEKKHRWQYFMEIPNLFLNRWVGLEAIMVSSSYQHRGMESFKKAFFDDAKLGVKSMFQRISKAQYSKSKHFTFMTLAGPIAILYLSNSFVLLTLGMAMISIILILVEESVKKYIGNPFVTSLCSLALAYNATQITFPYLTAIFLAQLITTLFFIYLVTNLQFSCKFK